MWLEGSRYGAVDPCFPAKAAQAHIHNLLFHKHQPEKGRSLDYIYFPLLNYIPGFVTDTMDNVACPIVSGTPAVMKAAFTKEVDFFAQRGIEYVDEAAAIEEPNYLKKTMFASWGQRLGITRDESDFAVEHGLKALRAFNLDVEDKGRAILETVEAENGIAILVLGRPYHSDPGMNHAIPEEFQVLGYPILSIRSIPKSREYLDRYFKDELERGLIETPLQISHIWPENYQTNSTARVWAANFAAHHPNVAVLDLSSFKCGNDAPTYGLIDKILTAAKTPVAAIHDIDANKPGGSIKIRVKTYAHSLRLQRERLEDVSRKRLELELSIERKRLQLFEAKQRQLEAMARRDERIDEAIAALRDRILAYEIELRPPAAADPGLVQIRVRRDEPAAAQL
jgi:predicted nucleotide-binding protein (sugar kinase/HSP70/actin superfamily)